MGLLERISRAAGAVAGPVLTRDVQPLEGTLMSLWNSIIPNWWTENGMNNNSQFFPGNGLLAQRVWITNRCIQMNSQQIASMPLRFEAPNVTAGPASVEPAWVSNPDPLNYPNGISSLLRALIRDYYGWGWCLLLITSRYANGYPRTFTRVPAMLCEPQWSPDGHRIYPVSGGELNADDIIQIDRDPGCDEWNLAHGTSAIRSYAQMAWGLLSAGNLAMEVNTGGVPKAVLKVTDENRKLNATQAENLQTQWQKRTQERNGAPPVLPPGLDFETLSWNPKDMALLETQEFNALALATAFGIPAILINMSVGGSRGNSSLTYQNPGMLGEMWWRFELRPTAKAIADALASEALPSGQWVWLDAKDTFLALDTNSEEDDPESAAVAADTSTDDDSSTDEPTPAGAAASPADGGGTRLAVAGGNQ